MFSRPVRGFFRWLLEEHASGEEYRTTGGRAEWGISELGRRARFYKLTAAGRKQLELEAENWARLTTAIGRVLEMA